MRGMRKMVDGRIMGGPPEGVDPKVYAMKERDKKIRAEFKEMFSQNKEQITTPADFESFGSEQLRNWEDTKVGSSYTMRANSDSALVLFKGSDNQLHSVEIDLNKLDLDGEDITPRTLDSYLELHTPLTPLGGSDNKRNDNTEEEDLFISIVARLYRIRNLRVREEDAVEKEKERMKGAEDFGL